MAVNYENKYFDLLHILKQVADFAREVAESKWLHFELKRKAKSLADRIDEEVASNKEE